ncbi:hypothetical protein GTP45_08050 [Pseudoduganella sp. FT55W]|uniref:Uncharacterized protein n=1 Tax=Duganella rivi TaxID=2666083 RepID=A0A7X4GNK7_9BURK|nr:hypothetical protein [Duganella rivi]MYM66778.1 hypothetical protein [Duganella rivi]
MPNCDFYATAQDHAPLLDWLFADGMCRVFELSSQFEAPLKEFHSTEEVLAEFERVYTNGRQWHTVHLQLYVVGAGPSFVPKRVELDPEQCNGAKFRYEADGWGLVQLYLSRAAPDGLRNSHTNHFTATGAGKWAPVYQEKPSPEEWDFKKIAAFSTRLNRQIKKLSIAKIGSRAVFPCAVELWNEGVSLLPFNPASTQLTLNRN